MNRKLLFFLVLLGVLVIVGGIFLIYSRFMDRIILRIDFDVKFAGDMPTYGAMYDGYLTIYNVGGRDVHNVSIEYTSQKIILGDIFVGENKTAFVKDFYIPIDPPRKRYKTFWIKTNEGSIYISTDEFYNRDWIF